MTRTRLVVLAAVPLAILVFAALASSQGQVPRSQTQVPLDATPVDHMTWSGHFDLVQEIRQRQADAKRAEKARAEADGGDTPSIAYLRATRAIWDDDRLRDAPAIVEAGVEIIRFHAFRHDQ